jgi:hypothetical protein
MRTTIGHVSKKGPNFKAIKGGPVPGRFQQWRGLLVPAWLLLVLAVAPGCMPRYAPHRLPPETVRQIEIPEPEAAELLWYEGMGVKWISSILPPHETLEWQTPPWQKPGTCCARVKLRPGKYEIYGHSNRPRVLRMGDRLDDSNFVMSPYYAISFTAEPGQVYLLECEYLGRGRGNYFIENVRRCGQVVAGTREAFPKHRYPWTCDVAEPAAPVPPTPPVEQDQRRHK